MLKAPADLALSITEFVYNGRVADYINGTWINREIKCDYFHLYHNHLIFKEKELVVYNFTKGVVLNDLYPFFNNDHELCISPDGKTMFVNNYVRITCIDLISSCILWERDNPDDAIVEYQNNKVIKVANAIHSQFCDVFTGEIIQQLADYPDISQGDLYCINFTNDRTALYQMGYTTPIQLWINHGYASAISPNGMFTGMIRNACASIMNNSTGHYITGSPKLNIRYISDLYFLNDDTMLITTANLTKVECYLLTIYGEFKPCNWSLFHNVQSVDGHVFALSEQNELMQLVITL